MLYAISYPKHKGSRQGMQGMFGGGAGGVSFFQLPCLPTMLTLH
jgi:hypothetical protein